MSNLGLKELITLSKFELCDQKTGQRKTIKCMEIFD
jgi:hypothetical protein